MAALLLTENPLPLGADNNLPPHVPRLPPLDEQQLKFKQTLMQPTIYLFYRFILKWT